MHFSHPLHPQEETEDNCKITDKMNSNIKQNLVNMGPLILGRRIFNTKSFGVFWGALSIFICTYSIELSDPVSEEIRMSECVLG